MGVVKSVCFVVPNFYLQLQLEDLGQEEKNKKIVKKWIRRDECESNIGNLKACKVEVVWKYVGMSGLQNHQRDILWMSYHECLSTRVFQKKRDLCASDICPRDGCEPLEMVNHLFWNCLYVKEVRERLNPFCYELFGVRYITWEIMMYGLYSLNQVKSRA
ncbi:hypothetical protein XELAEV_18032531mg [Xenopus laevis]|uniref:Reverse transcriptase zinc-binding domain-containing protein n=1 Tax=Xenopus laevis TaxID=8355 RepID=A0A974CRD3_XENLA|nr:hypothetical protein XELAEV_18032531mg [Xenopus laevis]